MNAKRLIKKEKKLQQRFWAGKITANEYSNQLHRLEQRYVKNDADPD
jgi:hypothetical protein